MLSKDAIDDMLLEERLKASLGVLEARKNRGFSIWRFFNSPLGLLVVSSVVIAGLGNLYTERKHGLDESARIKAEVLKIATEMDIRITEMIMLDSQIMNPLTSSQERQDSSIYIWRITVGDVKYTPSLPEFKDMHFSGLISRLRIYHMPHLATKSQFDAAIRATLNIEREVLMTHSNLKGRERTDIATLQNFSRQVIAALGAP